MKRSSPQRWLAGGLLLALAATPVFHAHARPVRPQALILLDIGKSGSTLTAVGERGVILRSEDDGGVWRMIQTDATRTLAGLAVAAPDTLVAVGHGGAVLRSQDNGLTWRTVGIPGLERESLLGVTAVAPNRLVAYGAFGLCLTSTDGGATWKRITVVDSDFDRHIYGVLPLTPDRWLLVGESGTIATTENSGASWRLEQSPYEGSFFGAVRTNDGAVVVFGMRGNVFRSPDGDGDWTRIETGATVPFNRGGILEDGRVALVGNNGALALSQDGGKSFSLTTLDRGMSLAAVVQARSGALLAVGSAGVKVHAPAPLATEEQVR